MTADVIALRARLVAEAEQAKREAVKCQQFADAASATRIHRSTVGMYYETARTATDAWLAADARLRALDGLIADRVELVEALAGMVAQHLERNGKIYSGIVRANADAVRVLARVGRVSRIDDDGGRVISGVFVGPHPHDV